MAKRDAGACHRSELGREFATNLNVPETSKSMEAVE